MKYQQPDDILSRRRRRTPSSSSIKLTSEDISNQHASDTSASPPLTPTQKLSSKTYYYSDTPHRRLSSPYISSHPSSDRGGIHDILTASLKLPVQMVSTAPPTSLNLGADLSDIPFIEDEGNGLCSEGIIKTQSPPRQIKPAMKKDTHPSLEKSNLQSLLAPINYKEDLASTCGLRSEFVGPNSSDQRLVETSRKTALIEKCVALPSRSGSSNLKSERLTSITNIGGDVLRSKTADFERLLSQQNKQSLKSNSFAESAAPSASSMEARLLNSPASTHQAEIKSIQSSAIHSALDRIQDGGSSISDTKRIGPIYKRRDVISSARKK